MSDMITAEMMALAEAKPGKLFVDQDGDVCIDDGRQFNLIFCPATDDGDIENGWPVLNPDVVAELVTRFNIAPDIARQLLATMIERDDALTRLTSAEADRDRLAAANAALEAQVARLVRERDDALTFLDNAVSQAPEPLRELGQWLSKMLDEDTWPTAERFLNAAVKSCAEVQADARREGGEWKGPGEAPHRYSPDPMAMGDCCICGHTRKAHE